MFDNSVIAELKKVVGFRDFWDLSEIPALGSPLNDSLSGEDYQDFSGAVRLDYIESLIPDNRSLTEFLDTIETAGITNVLNRIVASKQIGNNGKTLAESDIVFRSGRTKQVIPNEARFVGIKFILKCSTGIRVTLNRVGLFLTSAVTDLDLYLFHSTQEQSVATFQFTSTTTNSFTWDEISRNLDYDDGSLSGGIWYFGYYQDDLNAQSAQAIRHTDVNFTHGPCNSCGNRALAHGYGQVSNRVSINGFYVPSASLPAIGTKFDDDVTIDDPSNNWGMNFNITTGCNLTQFWKDNKLTLKTAIGLSVSIKILEMMKFSSQINNIEEGVKIMIRLDLEGAPDTGNPPLYKRLAKEIKALILDEGNLDKDCLPIARKPRIRYGPVG